MTGAHDNHKDGPQLTVLESLASGGLAGACSKTLIAPGDRVKILYQVNKSYQFSLRHAWQTGRSIVRKHGFTALWRGNGATIIRVVPYAAITYSSFDRYHQLLTRLVRCDKNVYTRLAAGSAAGATATACTYPFDLMRARMAVYSISNPNYRGYGLAFRHVYHTEGPSALFRGMPVTLIGIMPYAGISFATFETLKAWDQRQRPPDTAIPTHHRVAFGGIAGLIGQSATYPLDIVRRRMQVHDSSSGVPPFKSIWDAFVTIYRTEGRKGLYKGLSMNWIKGPIAVAVSFSINDSVKSTFLRWRQRDDHTTSNRYGEIKQISPAESMLAGAFAGFVAKSLIAPLDRIKILYQVNPERPFTYRRGCRTAQVIYANAGPDALWRGNLASVLRVLPFSAIAYTTFDRLEMALMALRRCDTDVWGRFLAGAGAGATATLITYPFDLLRVRQAAHWHLHPRYPGYVKALLEIVSTEGIGALWNGLRPTLLGIAPYAGLSFATFETLKASIRTHYKSDADVPMRLRLGAGMAAGLVGQISTYPLHVVRRRMQVLGPDDSRSMTSVFSHIWRREGVARGLYKGMSLTVVKGPIVVAASFAVNDFCRAQLRENRDTWLDSVVELSESI
eukprot:TRINITY_DN10315_c0_g1_i1.p1 TRINITY_DN10315_c0_g1~~TRINITY_DN10315_c0_g1_i1.p1  ORF type:complete len:637 (+),score=110.74 TRINITY_DN10315_c0_g1_i1:55-1911(+)